MFLSSLALRRRGSPAGASAVFGRTTTLPSIVRRFPDFER
jgi:hypothetical protein